VSNLSLLAAVGIYSPRQHLPIRLEDFIVDDEAADLVKAHRSPGLFAYNNYTIC